jgi:ABC-type antimicrobial peptide transport system permease subunit
MKDAIEFAVGIFLSTLGIILGVGLGTFILILIGFLTVN